MARTSLGKRSRDVDEEKDATAELSPRRTRSKRQADFVIAADEQESPFITRKFQKTAHHGNLCNEANELALENILSPKKHSSVQTTPAKHGAPNRRIPLSPNKCSDLQSLSANVVHADAKPSTPSTPRHRDALSKIPITPRHRVGIVGRPHTPQTPRVPSTPHAGPSVYNLARQAFASGAEDNRLIGRENERDELQQFLEDRVKSSKSGCIYVSGPPGTGKSALVNEVCGGFTNGASFAQSYVNCMSVKTTRDISAKLLEDFSMLDVYGGAETEALNQLFHQDNSSHLIVMDEIDHLLDVDIDLLYQIFEWSMDPTTNLVVIGIANALDFTDRFLPRLKSRGLRPQLLPFMPYSASQIASVLTSKLKALLPNETSVAKDFIPFLHPSAIQFASKKVAAQTGDLRKAFAISSRAIDLVELETRTKWNQTTAEITPSPTPSPSKTPLMENMNLSSPNAVRSPKAIQKSQGCLDQYTIETAPRATIAHMARVTATVFSHGSNQRLMALNLQQKAILCSLFVLEKRLRDQSSNDVASTPSKSCRTPAIKSLHAAYTSLCKSDNIIHPLTATEFRDVLASLEALSLVSWVDGKNGTFTAVAPGTPSRRGRGGGFGAKIAEEKKVASAVVLKELKDSLKGPASDILLSLLAGEGL